MKKETSIGALAAIMCFCSQALVTSCSDDDDAPTQAEQPARVSRQTVTGTSNGQISKKSITTFSYDALGRIVETKTYSGIDQEELTEEKEFTYSDGGLVIRLKVLPKNTDAKAVIIEDQCQTNSQGYITKKQGYTYYEDEAEKELVSVTTYEYDADGHLVRIDGDDRYMVLTWKGDDLVAEDCYRNGSTYQNWTFEPSGLAWATMPPTAYPGVDRELLPQQCYGKPSKHLPANVKQSISITKSVAEHAYTYLMEGDRLTGWKDVNATTSPMVGFTTEETCLLEWQDGEKYSGKRQ